MDVCIPAGFTQEEEGRTGFLHLPSAVLALIFLSLSLVDRGVESGILCTHELIVLHYLLGMYDGIF